MLSKHVSGRTREAMIKTPSTRKQLTILLASLFLPPSSVQIEPTTKCNLRCTICLRTCTYPDMSYDMTVDVFKLAIEQLKRSTRLVKTAVRLFGLGEPLMNPHIGLMVKHAKEEDLTVEMISNFALMDRNISEQFVEAQLDYLSISFDAASPQTFEKIRVGAKFKEVVSNIRTFLEVRKSMNSVKPLLFFNSTISEKNAGEIPAIIELAKSLEIDGVNLHNQIKIDKETYEYPLSTSLRFKKSCSGKTVQIQTNRLSSKDKSTGCPAMRRCYITFDGRVLPCNFLMEILHRDEYPHFQFGDITKTSFHSIWFSKRYMEFRLRKAMGYHPYFCGSCPCLVKT